MAKLVIEIDTNTLSAEEVALFCRESKKATGIRIEVGHPSRKGVVRGFGDIEAVPSTVMALRVLGTGKFTAREE